MGTQPNDQKQLDFFNTNNLEGEELITEESKAKTQEINIISIFLSVENGLTPWEVKDIYDKTYSGGIEITSCRRAITVLTNRLILSKTNEQKLEKLNKNNYIWKLNHQLK